MTVPISVQMAQLFATLPLGTRCLFYPLRVAIREALEFGDTAAAIQLLENTSVPTELTSTKTALLTLLSAV